MCSSPITPLLCKYCILNSSKTCVVECEGSARTPPSHASHDGLCAQASTLCLEWLCGCCRRGGGWCQRRRHGTLHQRCTRCAIQGSHVPCVLGSQQQRGEPVPQREQGSPCHTDILRPHLPALGELQGGQVVGGPHLWTHKSSSGYNTERNMIRGDRDPSNPCRWTDKYFTLHKWRHIKWCLPNTHQNVVGRQRSWAPGGGASCKFEPRCHVTQQVLPGCDQRVRRSARLTQPSLQLQVDMGRKMRDCM